MRNHLAPPVTTQPSFPVSARFERAIDFAIDLHRNQARKRSPGEPGPPYVGHMLGVTGLVLEDGGSEEEAIAAVLHDSIEDQDEPHLRDRIREEFGDRVLQIVKGVSAEQKSTERKPIAVSRREAGATGSAATSPTWRQRTNRHCGFPWSTSSGISPS